MPKSPKGGKRKLERSDAGRHKYIVDLAREVEVAREVRRKNRSLKGNEIALTKNFD